MKAALAALLLVATIAKAETTIYYSLPPATESTLTLEQYQEIWQDHKQTSLGYAPWISLDSGTDSDRAELKVLLSINVGAAVTFFKRDKYENLTTPWEQCNYILGTPNVYADTTPGDTASDIAAIDAELAKLDKEADDIPTRTKKLRRRKDKEDNSPAKRTGLEIGNNAPTWLTGLGAAGVGYAVSGQGSDDKKSNSGDDRQQSCQNCTNVNQFGSGSGAETTQNKGNSNFDENGDTDNSTTDASP